MQGTCTICHTFQKDVAPCPKCGEIICLHCYEVQSGCCVACKVEQSK